MKISLQSSEQIHKFSKQIQIQINFVNFTKFFSVYEKNYLSWFV